MESAAHILILGVVQGVGYRYFAIRSARDLGLKGYVRNLPGDAVEVEVEGERRLILEFFRALRVGPPAAYVRDAQLKWDEPTGEFTDFGVRF